MKPAVKYSALTALHSAWPLAVWEQSIFHLLDQRYRRSELAGLREELVGLRTLGWLEVEEETEFDGQLLRKYRLVEAHRDNIARQISLEKIFRFLNASDDEGTRI